MHYEKFADGTIKCIENEIPFELPKGWEWCRLINVSTEIIAGGDKPEIYSKDKTETNIIPIYSNGVENRGLYGYTNGARILEPSITISARGTIGFCCLRNEPFVPIIRLISITPILMNIIYLKSVFQVLIEKSEGSSIPQLTVPAIKPKLIPIPPIKEQNRITLKINELLSFVDTIESAKADFQSTIQLIKSKILDLAIRGKLVPQDPNDEPATVLLERIRAEKEKLIEQGKIKRDKKESFIFKGEDNSYYQKIGNLVETLDDWQIDDLPETWGLCCLGEVCDYGNCTNVDTKDISDTAWILDLEDIEKDTGKVLQKFTKKERSSASTKHLFYKGQVLYSKLRPYLNKVVLADNDGYCTSEILPLDFNACIFPEYAKYYLMSPTFLRYANHCSYGVKMPRLGTQDGKKAVLTVPPINEQKRIANKISQLFSMLDSIEENIN